MKKVYGMLFYAKTDDNVIPSDSAIFDMSGNTIAVKSLDISGDFQSIAKQPDEIAGRFII